MPRSMVHVNTFVFSNRYNNTIIKLGANGVNIRHVAQHVAAERGKKIGHVKVESPVKEAASGRQRSPKIVIKNHAQVTLS